MLRRDPTGPIIHTTDTHRSENHASRGEKSARFARSGLSTQIPAAAGAQGDESTTDPHPAGRRAALPTAARADAGQAWAGPRWAEVDAEAADDDQARVFRDLEDGFEVAYPSNNWMRTQPLPELLGGAPPRRTRSRPRTSGRAPSSP